MQQMNKCAPNKKFTKPWNHQLMLKTILNALSHTNTTAKKPREVLASVSWLRSRTDLCMLTMHFCLNADYILHFLLTTTFIIIFKLLIRSQK
jgi:hypothetical protein